jgi:photosystem II stability/assembly factor-like uncharacterized protein
MNFVNHGRTALLFSIALLFAMPASAQTWHSMGPPGGDVFALAAAPGSPNNLFLGTADGHIFNSNDSGESWNLLGRAGSQDAVVMALLVDPRDSKLIFASTWARNGNGGGGVFRSEDGGVTWKPAGLVGQAVRALAQAPSNPDVLVAGTLNGIYRSNDAARTWQRISPEGDEELRNLDSIAIDPRDPDIIYAGTFHLPWKTTNGGKNWVAIHEGMIDDSDVMSIIVDRTNPRRIYASSCSGIYRSDNGGALWRKIQGIPYSARRTHVIRQDPHRAATIYAGTTEGLWKTTDAGASWKRVTPAHWVINALVLDAASPDRLVMGTEKLGVQVSTDGGKTFRAANDGFSHRQIIALALDRERPGRVLAILAQAPEPVLATDDGGQSWAPLGPGLRLEALKRVYASPGGWWAALERGGLMRYDDTRRAWVAAGQLTANASREMAEAIAARDAVDGKKRNARSASRATGARQLNLVVLDMAFSRTAWFAATPEGLLVSRDHGATWDVFPVGPVVLPARSVRVSSDGQQLWVVTLRGMAVSRDTGASWKWLDLPFEAGGALRLDVAEESTLFATARKGLYVSQDNGATWRQAANGLPEAPIQDLAIVGEIILASMQTRGLYVSADRGQTWTRVEGTLAEGLFPVVAAGDNFDTIFAGSSTDGLYAVGFPMVRGANTVKE